MALIVHISNNTAGNESIVVSADDLFALWAAAQDRSQEVGVDAKTAFTTLLAALGRGSVEGLDNLGIMISPEKAARAYAKNINKTTSDLTDAEQKQAIVNTVLSICRAIEEGTL